MMSNSSDSCRVGCIQLNSGSDRQANLKRVASLIGKAAQGGCKVILLPENFSFMAANDGDKLTIAEEQNNSSTLHFLAGLAERYKVMIIGGTLPLISATNGKVRNSCPVFSASGKMLVCYDKMHLFDVTLPDEQYCESDSVEAGVLPETVELDGWKIGLSICYDLRFPELYRHYSSIGCNILTVPAAFTVPTGKAHWKTLLRARAIENQCYVLAAGQCGEHPGGRNTWGHSMIVDPWGEIIAEAGNEETVIIAEISLSKMNTIRQIIPALTHRRM